MSSHPSLNKTNHFQIAPVSSKKLYNTWSSWTNLRQVSDVRFWYISAYYSARKQIWWKSSWLWKEVTRGWKSVSLPAAALFLVCAGGLLIFLPICISTSTSTVRMQVKHFVKRVILYKSVLIHWLIMGIDYALWMLRTLMRFNFVSGVFRIFVLASPACVWLVLNLGGF